MRCRDGAPGALLRRHAAHSKFATARRRAPSAAASCSRPAAGS